MFLVVDEKAKGAVHTLFIRSLMSLLIPLKKSHVSFPIFRDTLFFVCIFGSGPKLNKENEKMSYLADQELNKQFHAEILKAVVFIVHTKKAALLHYKLCDLISSQIFLGSFKKDKYA